MICPVCNDLRSIIIADSEHGARRFVCTGCDGKDPEPSRDQMIDRLVNYALSKTYWPCVKCGAEEVDFDKPCYLCLIGVLCEEIKRLRELVREAVIKRGDI